MRAKLPKRGFSTKSAATRSLETRIRRLDEYISSTLSKYGVTTLEELEEKIRRGEIPEHPAWEDLIVLEDLVEYRRELTRALKRVETLEQGYGVYF